MSRVKLGDQCRDQAITSLYSKNEKARILKVALDLHIPPGLLVRQAVMSWVNSYEQGEKAA